MQTGPLGPQILQANNLTLLSTVQVKAMQTDPLGIPVIQANNLTLWCTAEI